MFTLPHQQRCDCFYCTARLQLGRGFLGLAVSAKNYGCECGVTIATALELIGLSPPRFFGLLLVSYNR